MSHYGNTIIIDGATAVPSPDGGLHGRVFSDVGLEAFDLQQLLATAQQVAGSEFGQRVLAAAQQHGPTVAQILVDKAQTDPVGTAVSSFRVVAGSGGWTYQQDADGAITILAVPGVNYTSSIGKKFTSGTAWTAISNEIGPYPLAEEAGVGGGAAAGLLTALAAGANPDFRNSAGSMMTTDDDALKATQRKLALKAAGVLTTAAATAITSGSAAAGGAVAAASTATASGLVGSMLAAAGVSASVPVVGWITAAGIAAVAGGISIVRAVKGKKAGKKIAAAAVKLGMDKKSAKQVPAFVNRVSKMSDKKIDKVGARLMKALERETSKPKWLTPFRNKKRLKAKLAVLAATDLVRRAASNGLDGFALGELIDNGVAPAAALYPPPVVEVPNVPLTPRAPPAYGPGHWAGGMSYHTMAHSAWAGAPVIGQATSVQQTDEEVLEAQQGGPERPFV